MLPSKMERPLCSWVGILNNVKNVHSTQIDIQSVQSLSKSQWHFFTKTRKNNTNIHMEPQRSQISKTILRKKNKVIGITLPDSKLK